ncbi:MAG: phosphoglycerate mutase family protein [Bacteroidetes bacterium]|nr:phosphoglycerate mutase family protein [Bacteroidota bacterium]MDA1019035.1 phosphoglycerate mutase family protein [Bacteroidota bacterium]
MKRLVIIRHAKSSWEDNIDDLKRPISNQGYTDSQIMSGIFNNLDIKINAIFSSHSKRTLQTAEIFHNNLSYSSNINIVKSFDLYDFSGNIVDEFVKNINNKLDNVMIFTHNNSCNKLALVYGGISNLHVPTSGILIFEFDVSLWSDIIKGKCNYYFPKIFK